MHLRSTKDRKKGCTYDPGALNKQGALKKTTDSTVCREWLHYKDAIIDISVLIIYNSIIIYTHNQITHIRKATAVKL